MKPVKCSAHDYAAYTVHSRHVLPYWMARLPFYHLARHCARRAEKGRGLGQVQHSSSSDTRVARWVAVRLIRRHPLFAAVSLEPRGGNSRQTRSA